jgi:hypothetical protein
MTPKSSNLCEMGEILSRLFFLELYSFQDLPLTLPAAYRLRIFLAEQQRRASLLVRRKIPLVFVPLIEIRLYAVIIYSEAWQLLPACECYTKYQVNATQKTILHFLRSLFVVRLPSGSQLVAAQMTMYTPYGLYS